MKLLFDLFPVILFFATFKYYGSNPEGAAGVVGSLLGSAVLDVKQAPIPLPVGPLHATLVFDGEPAATGARCASVDVAVEDCHGGGERAVTCR